MNGQALKLNDLRVSFPGGVEAVRGLSIAVESGVIHAVVGESGSGKSVTSKAVMGLLPNSADVSWSSLEVAGLRFEPDDSGPHRIASIRGRHAAMIFQEPGKHLNPALTAGSLLREVTRRHFSLDLESARSRAADLLTKVDLDPRVVMRSYPHELSGGMKQRVLIAAAVSCDPELLLADEPTTALDVTVQGQILDLLDRLRQDLGMAVILVSHDLGVVQSVADVVSVMYAGRIVETAAADEVFSHPVHPYTELLLQAVPRISNRGKRLKSIPGRVPDASAIPRGCAFHPRCPLAEEICRSEVPTLEAVRPEHDAACHLA